MFGLKPFSGQAFAQGPANVYAASITETTITETDSEVVVATFITVISEALSLADSPAYTALGFITEALTSADSMLGVGNFAGVISEGLSPIDVPTVTAAFASLISEPNTLADSPAGGYNVVITENAGFADSPTGFGTFVFAVIENIIPAENQTKVSAYPVSITEALSALADVPIGLPIYAVSISEGSTVANAQIGGWNVAVTENTTIVDNKTVVAAFASSVSEGITPADLESVVASFVSSISEGNTIGDSQYGRGWFIINDNQTITWVSLDDSQTPNWTQIYNSQ